MKFQTIAILAAAVTIPCSMIYAQGDEPHGPPPGPGGPGHHPPPIILALDINHDGIISADEIKKAPESLLKLDKNGDGELTRDELHPPHPPGDGDGPEKPPKR